MADFSHLGKLKINKDKTADYTFYDVEGEPTLRCVHAGETNKPYFNEVLRRTEQVMRRKSKLSLELLKDQRDRDRDLFPKHIVRGWPVAPLDKDGASAPYDQANVEGFLRALPDHIFDGFRAWAKEADNFTESIDGGSVAGNSQTV